ncbi:G-type lectin S-receptor-like serine/threonine-protein kinase At4g27290 [Rutidosis leptorrhynchoides]|uniref:G-type lectin S-receptor-like serine/threonine-protein kinase At4g27290 n=1 Tax=Rutidosis leptorrhynchoides TaxID=125765 RepID=UPI003A99676A
MIWILMDLSILVLLFSLLCFDKIHATELSTISGSQVLTNNDTLVSPAAIFELGFFQPDNTASKYLGIWYKKISVKTVVWVANRDHPITNASAVPLVLNITDLGNLVLFNNSTIIWSSNTTSTASISLTVKLLDTGNLVMVGPQEKMIWQSFDHPTDTLLPGMKLGKDYLRDIEWHLTSWNSNQDPSPSGLTWGADIIGYPENKLRQGSVVKYRGGPWSNQRFTGASQFNRSLTFVYEVVLTKSEVSFSYILENSSMLTRTALNSSGQLESSVWVEEGKKWQLSLSLPRDICDTYNICGEYGSCSLDTVTQSCACFDEKRFVPRDEKRWDTADFSGGCVRRTPLDCKNGSDGFIKYSNVKLPDAEDTWFNMSMSLNECEEECLKNCSCMAYANPDTNVGSRGCVIWLSDLKDIRVYSAAGVGQDIFVKMASSEIVGQSSNTKKGDAKVKIMLVVIIPVVLIICGLSTWLWYARKKRKHAEQMEGGVSESQLPLFSFSTIATATANFSTDNVLGEGGFGPVYKGVLKEGLEIAVKRHSKTSGQGIDEFKNEVITVSKLQHRNLVKLLGCCIQGDEKLLVYEYMPNKSLDSLIFDQKQSMVLNWSKRFNIIKGIARGLLYLHHDSRLRIIHRDLKASNILLDEDMNPKISDFGIARSFGGNETEANTHRVVGTYGYMAPEYALDGLFSIKSDVFSYGVLVLEIVSGKKNRGFIHPEHDNNLIGHAWSVYNEGRSMELIDENLAKSCDKSEVIRSIEVGLLCVQQNAGDRPNMSSVVRMLDDEGTLPIPKQPAFYMQGELLVADFTSSTYNAGSVSDLTITEVDSR